MAEIPRAFLQRRQGGSPPVTGGLPGVSRTPQLGDTGALIGQAVEGLGRQVQQSGSQLFKAAEARKKERDAIDAVDITSRGLVDLETLDADIQRDASIEDLDKAAAFRDRASQMIDTALEGVSSPRARALVQQQLGKRLATKIGSIADSGERAFRARSEASRQFLLEQARVQLLSETPEEQQATLSILRTLGAELAESGAVQPEVFQREMVALQEGASVDKMRLIISSDPHLAETYLSTLAKTGERPAGFGDMPDIELDEVRALLSEARGLRQNFDREEIQRDQQADLEEDEEQQAAAVELRNRLYEEGLSIDRLIDVKKDIRAAATDGSIDARSHAPLLSLADTIHRAKLRGRTVTQNPGLLAEYKILAFGQPRPNDFYDMLVGQIQGAVDSGDISIEDAQPLFTKLAERKDAEHYSKVPEVAEGTRFLEAKIAASSQFVEGALPSDFNLTRDINDRKAEAVFIYNDRLEQLSATGGRAAVAAQARSLARELAAELTVSPQRNLETLPPVPHLKRPGEDGMSIDDRFFDAVIKIDEDPLLTDTQKAAQFLNLRHRIEAERQQEQDTGASESRRDQRSN